MPNCCNIHIHRILRPLDTLDSAITALGCVAMDLEGTPPPEELEAVRWLFSVLRKEAGDLRDIVDEGCTCTAEAPTQERAQ
jgi:hypothetical protein